MADEKGSAGPTGAPEADRLPGKKLKRCFLHIGSPKTGTSSIQGALFKNRKRLRKLGFFYPNNDANHIFLASYFREDPTEIRFHAKHGRETPELIAAWNKAEMDRFLRELQAFDGHTLIISSEYLPKTSPEKCQEMAAFLRDLAEEVTVVCYVRHPVSHATSSTQQGVKVGFRPLEDALQGANFFPASTVLPKFRDAFGRNHMAVRQFDRKRLKDGNVVPDFLEFVGVPEAEIGALVQRESNSSLSYEATLLADALTRQFPREIEGIWNPARARTINLMQIRGTPFALEPDAHARVQAEAAEEIAFLRDEFGLDFSDKAGTVPEGPKAAWSDETILDIAARLNRYALEAQHLKAEVLHLRSMEAARAKRPGRALAHAREAVNLNPQNMAYLTRLCRLLMAAGRTAEAHTYAERYIKLFPDDPEGPALLASLSEQE